MTSFTNYDRIIIMEGGSITHLIVSEENLPDKVLPPVNSAEDTLDYLQRTVLNDKNPNKDLIISILNSPINGELRLIRDIIDSKGYSGNKTGILVMSNKLDTKEYSEVKETGIDNIILGLDNVKAILDTLKVKH